MATKPADPKVFEVYVASKHPSGTPERDELENADSVEDRGSTVFHRENDEPGVYDYQIKGFFKDACGALRRADDTLSKDLKAYKSVIDGVVFVNPRFLLFRMPEGSVVGVCERPIMTQSAKGPRVALARSESVPVGTTLEFEVQLLAKATLPLVKEWLNYGALRGLGAWRNSGRGRFSWEKIS